MSIQKRTMIQNWEKCLNRYHKDGRKLSSWCYIYTALYCIILSISFLFASFLCWVTTSTRDQKLFNAPLFTSGSAPLTMNGALKFWGSESLSELLHPSDLFFFFSFQFRKREIVRSHIPTRKYPGDDHSTYNVGLPYKVNDADSEGVSFFHL